MAPPLTASQETRNVTSTTKGWLTLSGIAAVLCWAPAALAAPANAVILYTGDNGGEIAPCG